MTGPNDPQSSGMVTLRELYTLLEKTRSDFLLEIQKLRNAVDGRFVDHEAKHEKEAAHRTSMIRWAVTTVLAAAGVGVAIYVASRGGPG